MERSKPDQPGGPCHQRSDRKVIGPAIVGEGTTAVRYALSPSGGVVALMVDPGRVELDGGKVIVAMPCCCRSVVLRREEVHPRALRRVACAHGVWRLEFLSDAQATWRALWTPEWSEPALRAQRGLRGWRARPGAGR